MQLLRGGRIKPSKFVQEELPAKAQIKLVKRLGSSANVLLLALNVSLHIGWGG